MTFKLLIYFFVLLNPFSQLLYLWQVMKDFEWRAFAQVYWRATLLSFGVYALFAVAGDFLFTEVFQVRFDAFRIFGGLIVLLMGYRYITDGAGSNLMFRGKAEDLAPEISLPFMVGPATIWVSIMLGKTLAAPVAIGGIAGVLLLNYGGVVLAHRFLGDLERQRDTMAAKYVAILMRTNALFIGAIGIEMILTGIENAFHIRGLPRPPIAQ